VNKLKDPNDAVDYLILNAEKFAEAKANRIYMEELRKTIKAELCKEAMSNGFDAVNAQEREAYSHPKYRAHLIAIKDSVEIEEKMRWMMIAAEARIDVWRSLEASKRIEAKVI
jgi:hypothetical protein